MLNGLIELAVRRLDSLLPCAPDLEKAEVCQASFNPVCLVFPLAPM